jgi:4-hydroxyphenylacetate 3-monooxygenase
VVASFGPLPSEILQSPSRRPTTLLLQNDKRGVVSLDLTKATGAITGAQYIDRLRDGRRVWLRGELIDVTNYPALAGTVREIARLYDLQHDPEFRDRLTCISPETGNRISTSYLLPRTPEDLAARRASAEVWAEESWGLLLNSSDYMASALVGLHDFGDEIRAYDAQVGENAAAYYRYAAEHDLAVAHALADPLAERSELYPGYSPDPEKGLQIVQETAEGVVVRGVVPLAPMAPLAHEVFVYCTSTLGQPERNPAVQWFALPMNAPGLTILCHDLPSASGADPSHPFASRYNEPDATLFFEDVLVPRERLFLAYNAPLAQRGLERLRSWLMYSANIRSYYYLWSIVGVAAMLAEATGVDTQRGMRDKLGEITIYPELFKSALIGSEVEAAVTSGGLLAPSPGLSLATFAEQYTRRILDLVRDIAGAGLVQQVSEADLSSPQLQPLIERYLGSAAFSAPEKARLFRLAWDLLGDGAGARKELYERWLRGDIVRTKNQLFLNYDREELSKRIKEMVSHPLPQGETPAVWELAR